MGQLQHQDPGPSVLRVARKRFLAAKPASATQPERYPPACTSTALPDSPDPAAHTHLPPSTPPAARRSFPARAPRTGLQTHPVSLPALSDNAPAGSLDGSTRHTSASLLQKPRPPLPVSGPPAPRITRECTSRSDIQPRYRSTHTEPVAAPPPATSPADQQLPRHPPPSLLAGCGSIQDNARSSPLRTTTWHTLFHRKYIRPLPAALASDQTSPSPEPAHAPAFAPTPEAQAVLEARSAMRTSPGTTGCATGCEPVAPVR